MQAINEPYRKETCIKDILGSCSWIAPLFRGVLGTPAGRCQAPEARDSGTAAGLSLEHLAMKASWMRWGPGYFDHLA
jgi:hypothetical protein